jgi:peptide/nickel transport system ATP-binding protein
MRQGQIVECGPAQAVLARPSHDYTRELLATAPRPGTILTAED